MGGCLTSKISEKRLKQTAKLDLYEESKIDKIND